MRQLSRQTIRQPQPVEDEFVVVDAALYGENEGIDLRDYWRIITKHRWLMLSVFCVIAAVNAVIALNKIPYYTAETTVLIEQQSPQILDIQQALAESSPQYDYYQTQYRILQSRALAAQVIQQLRLQDSLFAPHQPAPGLISTLTAKVSEALQRWRGAAGAAPPPSHASAPDRQGANIRGVKSQFINGYLGMLAVNPIRKTRLVNISFTTPEPELSARVANAHAHAYIRKGIELRTQTNETAQTFLEEKLVELRERVEKSEAALNQYRREKGVISLDGKENFVVARLSDLNQRLTQAEAERIALEAQMHIIRNRDYNSLPEVINSRLIQTLKEQQITFEGQYVKLRKTFKSNYSGVEEMKALMEETAQRLQREIDRIVSSVESAYLTAVQKEKNLRAEMEQQKATTLSLKDASVGYAMLAREVDTNRQLYDSVLQRMKEMGMAAELRTSNVSIIDPAETPLGPSRPHTSKDLLFGLGLGLVGGIGLAFVVDFLDNTLKTPEDVEQYLHLSSLGMIPDFFSATGNNSSSDGRPPTVLLLEKETGRNGVKREDEQGANDPNTSYLNALRRSAKNPKRQKSLKPTPKTTKYELVLSHHPLSIVSESYRSLRVALLLSRAEETPRSILFTSGTHSEGKTATTVNTAIVFAQMGVKVLVIDGDLRRPRCHKMLKNVEKGPGLVDLLTGQREPQEVIQQTLVENLSLLSSGDLPPNPAELIGSNRMRESLTLYQQHYDYILIDSPPIMPVSDALLLSTVVDGVVLVARGQQTPRHIVQKALTRLEYARAKILGVVLNGVDLKSGDYSDYEGLYYSPYHAEGQGENELTSLE